MTFSFFIFLTPSPARISAPAIFSGKIAARERTAFTGGRGARHEDEYAIYTV